MFSFHSNSLINFVSVNNKDFSEIKGVNLLYRQNDNPLLFLPKNFTISTQRGSFKFNIYIIKTLSPIVDRFINDNPKNMQYNMNINDETNVMSKFEQLCLGNIVDFSSNDIFLMKTIIQNLNLNCFPRFIQSDTIKISSNDLYMFKLVISKKTLISFLQKFPKKFTIITKKAEYKCNIAGVNSSKVISKLIHQDSKIDRFIYDFKDEESEFQIICDYFNYSTIQITPNNFQIIKKIAKDLQIECIFDEIDNFCKNYISLLQIIKKHQFLIDSVEELTEYLYNRKHLEVESVKDYIINSIWSSEEKYVLELSAYICQVINTEFRLHQFLIELIILLDKTETDKQEIKKLKPFLIKTLLNNIGCNKYNCWFIYRLYKNGIILLEELITAIDKGYKTNYLNFDNTFIWFFPEIMESNNNIFNLFLNKINIQHKAFFEQYYPSNIEKFKTMRDNGEPDDELTKALLNDDVDKLSIILSNKLSISTDVPYNMFDSIIENGYTSLIECCSFYGSVKCFQYLLSKKAPINPYVLSYSYFNEKKDIFEIIKDKKIEKERYRHLFKIENECQDLSKPIKSLIIKHKNNIFDNIHVNEFQSGNIDFYSLIRYIFKNGNIHSFIKFIIDDGLDLYSLSQKEIKEMISYSSSSGFYILTNLLFDLLFKNEYNPNTQRFLNNPLDFINIDDYASYGNLFILQLIESLNIEKIEFKNPLIKVIKNDDFYLLKYILETQFRQKININSEDVLKLINESFINTNMFLYLKEQLIDKEKIIKNFPNPYDETLLSYACYCGNLKIVEILFDLITKQNPKINCSKSFVNAASNGYDNICSFLINKNAVLSFNIIVHDKFLASISRKAFSLLYDLANNEEKEKFMPNFIVKAIKEKNYDVVEFLLEKNCQHDDALFEAVKESDSKMVGLILKYDSSPSFINQISEEGTALKIAVDSNKYEIS